MLPTHHISASEATHQTITKPHWLPVPPRSGEGLGHWLTPQQGQDALTHALNAVHEIGDWQREAAHLKTRILEGAGLATLPLKTSLNPVIHRCLTTADYTVEAISFSAIPGFQVTGNLYLPQVRTASMPLVLSFHGHTGDRQVGCRSETQQLRCGVLAKAGAAVLAIDLLGFGESLGRMTSTGERHEIPEALTLQLWSAIRAIDMLVGLPGADASRIAVTGESGGGTQSILLAALDSRVTVSVPVVMVSAHMFGGCPCESGLPIHHSSDHFTTNVGIAALAAPKPQLLISCGTDWTSATPQVEFPFLQAIYALYGATDMVHNHHLPNDGHDYGPAKRQAMYSFLLRHLNLNKLTDETAIEVVPHQRLRLPGNRAGLLSELPDVPMIMSALRTLQHPNR